MKFLQNCASDTLNDFQTRFFASHMFEKRDKHKEYLGAFLDAFLGVGCRTCDLMTKMCIIPVDEKYLFNFLTILLSTCQQIG